MSGPAAELAAAARGGQSSRHMRAYLAHSLPRGEVKQLGQRGALQDALALGAAGGPGPGHHLRGAAQRVQ